MNYIVVYNSPEYGGGVERDVNFLLKEFSNDFKKNLKVICSDPKSAPTFYSNSVECINLNVKRNKILDKILLLSRLKFSYKIYRFARKNLKKEDVLNIHGLEYCVFLGILKRKIKNVTIIVSSHGSLFQEARDYLSKALPKKLWYIKLIYVFFKWYYFFLEKLASKAQDYMVFICDENQEFFKKTYGFVNSEVIWNPFDIESEKPNSSKFKRTTKMVHKAVIIGSTEYRKGLDIAVEVIKNLNNHGFQIQLDIVGFESYDSKNPEYVHYHGRVKQSEVHQFISDSTFMLFPSRYESFGNVVIESYIKSTPAVVSRTCVKSYLNYDDYGVVVDGYDIDSWVSAVRELVSNYDTKIENLSQIDLSRFDSSTVAKQYEELFKKYKNKKSVQLKI
jgi:glycosyltransferase involved in cell wall biosynthesis